jgi:hypothetical protein
VTYQMNGTILRVRRAYSTYSGYATASRRSSYAARNRCRHEPHVTSGQPAVGSAEIEQLLISHNPNQTPVLEGGCIRLGPKGMMAGRRR